MVIMVEFGPDEFQAMLKQSGETRGVVTPEPPVEPPAPIVPPTPESKVPPVEPEKTPVIPEGGKTEGDETPPTPIELTDDQRLFAINQHFGTTYTSLAEAAKAKDDLAEVPTLRELRSKYEELEKTPRTTFANEAIREANNFVLATGIEDAGVHKLLKRYENSAEKDPIEALMLAKIIEKPSLADNREMLRKSIEKNYKLTVPEDLEGQDLLDAQSNAALEKFRLQQDSEDAGTKINDVLGKVKNYKSPEETSVQTNQATQEATKAQWEQTLSTKAIKDLFTSIPVQLPLGKDKDGNDILEVANTITLTPKEVDAVVKTVTQFASSNNLTLNDDNLQSLVNQQIEIIKFQHSNETAIKFADLRLAKEKLEWDKKIHNPSSKAVIEVPPGGPTKKTSEQELMENIDSRNRG